VFRRLSLIKYAQSAIEFIVINDAPSTSIRRVMGLKKRSLSLVGRGQPCNHCYKWWELAVCGIERLTAKGLGFFGHVTWQASGWREGEAVEHLEAETNSAQNNTENQSKA
jgi:hypothetical protein